MKKGTIISKISKKEQGNFPQNFKNYFQEAGDDDLLTALSQQQIEIEKLGQNVNEEKSLFAYAEDKWTLREVVQHLIDAERVFAYRALAFARKDANILPSFDENDYARYSYATDRAWSSLIAEFLAVRKSTEYLYESFSEEALNEIGKASNYTTGVITLGYVIVGHANHHFKIIKERYMFQ